MIRKIRLAEMEDIDIIVELLNKVTLQLHKKGINQWKYPWDFKEIEVDVKNKYTYVLIVDEKIVGTFSIKDIDNFDFLSIETHSKYLYRIAILPEYHGKNLGIEIINYSCQYVRKLDKTLYLDCWAGNRKLRNFYLNAGFDFIGDFIEKDYMISVFKFK